MPSVPASSPRFRELDCLRGFLIIGMVLYHLLFDLILFGYLQADVTNPFWLWLVRLGAGAFLLLVGVSLHLRRQRHQPSRLMFISFINRGLFVFSWGLVITLVTVWWQPGQAILFGILQLIGLSMIIAYPFISRPRFALLIGLLTILAATMNAVTFIEPLDIILGNPPADFTSLDYYPLFPWFGVVLLGIWLGSILYPNGQRRFKLNETSNIFLKKISLVGQHTLIIYLLHQPILLGLIFLIRLVTKQ